MKLQKENLQTKTNLTVDQVCKMLDENDRSYPRCFLADELGIAAFKENNSQAQDKLCKLLNDDESEKVIEVKHVSYCWLCVLENKTNKTIEALTQFVKNPENEFIITLAKEKRNISFSEN
jgi:hypothetical protein